MDLTTVGGMLTFAATTGIITALLNQVFGIARDTLAERSRRRTQAAYHAMRLATMLEAYAYACADLILENGNAPHLPDEPYPNWSIKLPELPPYPEAADGWHALETSLAVRAMDLHNHIAGSRGIILATAEFSPDEVDTEVDEHAAARGEEAFGIAKDLRATYDLPAFVPVWDFTGTLATARNGAERAKMERQEFQKKLFSSVRSDVDQSD